jgi:hypothetical protein
MKIEDFNRLIMRGGDKGKETARENEKSLTDEYGKMRLDS